MRRFALILFLILVLFALFSLYAISYLYDENLRLERNQLTLLSDVELYRTAAGESAASVGLLTLEVAELREARSRDAEQIRDLGIRLRRAESYARSATQSHYAVRAALRDTVILRDTVRDTIRIFHNSDSWSRVEGIIRDDSISVTLRSVDTLFQVVHRVPRQFLCFRFGTKAIRQEIVSSNPHTELVYSEYVELKRNSRRRR